MFDSQTIQMQGSTAVSLYSNAINLVLGRRMIRRDRFAKSRCTRLFGKSVVGCGRMVTRLTSKTFLQRSP